MVRSRAFPTAARAAQPARGKGKVERIRPKQRRSECEAALCVERTGELTPICTVANAGERALQRHRTGPCSAAAVTPLTKRLFSEEQCVRRLLCSLGVFLRVLGHV